METTRNEMYLLFDKDSKKHIQTFIGEQDLADFLGRKKENVKKSIKLNKVHKGMRIISSSDGTRYVFYTQDEFFERMCK